MIEALRDGPVPIYLARAAGQQTADAHGLISFLERPTGARRPKKRRPRRRK
jgi:hypothetical protein